MSFIFPSFFIVSVLPLLPSQLSILFAFLLFSYLHLFPLFLFLHFPSVFFFSFSLFPCFLLISFISFVPSSFFLLSFVFLPFFKSSSVLFLVPFFLLPLLSYHPFYFLPLPSSLSFVRLLSCLFLLCSFSPFFLPVCLTSFLLSLLHIPCFSLFFFPSFHHPFSFHSILISFSILPSRLQSLLLFSPPSVTTLLVVSLSLCVSSLGWFLSVLHDNKHKLNLFIFIICLSKVKTCHMKPAGVSLCLICC